MTQDAEKPRRMWLVRWWKRRQRRMDIAILWPACKHHADSLSDAKIVFAFHAFNDAGWNDLTQDEIYSIIEALQ